MNAAIVDRRYNQSFAYLVLSSGAGLMPSGRLSDSAVRFWRFGRLDFHLNSFAQIICQIELQLFELPLVINGRGVLGAPTRVRKMLGGTPFRGA
jgi:hypothetical protein